ncbi:hypothetical protein BN871_EV_00120 [Paenibacillus sp. P22]|nr:hypothetical protein BN871_EV_00120 [Paenibacillus sp. P22]
MTFPFRVSYDEARNTVSDVTGDEVGITTMEHRNIRPVAWAESKHAIFFARVALFVILGSLV